MLTWQPGEKVRLTYREQTTDATVSIVSPNGHSLLVEFDGMVAGYAGAMALLADRRGVYCSITDDEPVTLIRSPR